MNSCNHPNIPKIIKVLIPNDINNHDIYIIEENRGKNLYYITTHSPQIPGWNSDHIKYIIYQIFVTLLYLHVYNYIY